MTYKPSGLARLFPRPPNRSLASFVPTTLGAIDYVASQQNCQVFGTLSCPADTLRAVPFWAPDRPGASIGRIAVEVTTGSASNNIRIGIYQNVADPKSLYPGTMLVDSGNIDATTAALKTYATALALKRNRLYWMVMNTSASIIVRALNTIGVSSILGITDGVTGSTTPYNLYISVASAFGVLPSTYPGGGAYVSGTAFTPVLRYQFAS